MLISTLPVPSIASKKAIIIPDSIGSVPIFPIFPQEFLEHPLEKKGPRYRADFDPQFIKQFTSWLEKKYHIGMHGSPCGSDEDKLKIRLKCKPGRGRKEIIINKQAK